MEQKKNFEAPPEVVQKIKEFTKHIESKIWETSLVSAKPPFFPLHFQVWRKQSLNALQQYIENFPIEKKQIYLREFVNQVDNVYINDFILKIKQPYFEKVYFENYGVPKNVDIHQLKTHKSTEVTQELQRLAQAITEWCIQIEISVDVVERAEDLGLYESRITETQIYRDLKKQLMGERRQSYLEKFQQIFRQGLSYGMKSLSGMLWSNGMSSSNLTYGSLLIIYYAYMGTGTIPLSMIIPKEKIALMAGGILGSLALGKIAENMDINELELEIVDIKKAFKQITENLVEFNHQCKKAIDLCLKAENQKDLDLRKQQLQYQFQELLEQTEKFKQQRDDILKVRELVETEVDDWTLLEIKKSESEEMQKQIEMGQQQMKK